MGVRAGCAAALLSFCWYQQLPNKKHYQTIKHFALLTTSAKRDRELGRTCIYCVRVLVCRFSISHHYCAVCTESRCISGDRSECNTQCVSSSPERASVLSIMHFAIAASVFCIVHIYNSSVVSWRVTQCALSSCSLNTPQVIDRAI